MTLPDPVLPGADAQALAVAAARAGVQLGYRDAHGAEIAILPAVARQLIASLEVSAQPTRGKPPQRAVVGRAGRPIRVILEGESIAACTVVTERGETLRCRIAADDVIELPELEAGYHRLLVQPAHTTIDVIVGPQRCWQPSESSGATRSWGVSAQLYLLRSANDWGIGDFSTLRLLAESLARSGAHLLGLNPLHALFSDRPSRASPYSPASRLLLNVLNIDVDAIPEAAVCDELIEWMRTAEFQTARQACRSATLIDYDTVARLKLRALRSVFGAFQTKASDERRADFAAFRQDRGERFNTHCLFLALRDHFATRDAALADCDNWPEAYRSPDSVGVAGFAQSSADAVTWQVWMQWIADQQLAAAAQAAAAAGMTLGLYRDLAVGADPAGAEAWADPAGIVRGVRVGAPPDIFNPEGQDWGLPPFNPLQLPLTGYRMFIDLVRANMRHAGALRIDHVMALQQLYCIPAGNAPDAGAYVAYPFEALLTILALESHRHRCMVIGEDLGTVPEGFRERLAANGILSYRVLFFERDEQGAFLPAGAYPDCALTVAGNHDLPTIRGWLSGEDIAVNEALGRRTEEEAATARLQRRSDITALRARIGFDPKSAIGDIAPVEAVVDAIHRFLADTRCSLMAAQWEDLTGEIEQVNVPTTSDTYPNWRRRYSMSVADFIASGSVRERLAAISRVRPTP